MLTKVSWGYIIVVKYFWRRKMERQINKKLFFLLFIIFLAIFFLFIEYFHTETSFSSDEQDDCPVCIWERVSIASGKFFLFCLHFILIFFYMLVLQKCKVDFFRALLYKKTRAPPLIFWYCLNWILSGDISILLSYLRYLCKYYYICEKDYIKST